MDAAAQNGALEVVQWLHENRDEGCTGDALFFASKVRPASFFFLIPEARVFFFIWARDNRRDTFQLRFFFQSTLIA